MRLGAWWILALEALAGWVWGFAGDLHLTTDPACARYREPRPGSRLDRASRGVACSPCMADRAWGRIPESHVSEEGDR